MLEPGVEPTIRGYLHVLRRGRWWVAAFSLLGLGVSLALALTATKQYSATAQLLRAIDGERQPERAALARP